MVDWGSKDHGRLGELGLWWIGGVRIMLVWGCWGFGKLGVLGLW